jgi:hypothetical protein
MQVFDININPGAVRLIDIRAGYIYFLNGSAGGADSTIVFQPDSGGETVYLKPGQAYKMSPGVVGTRWSLRNLKGEAPIVGQVLLGEGDFFDNRISGSVEIIDGGKARTLAGLSFMGAVALAGAASMQAHVQLWNPPGSVKNIIVESIYIGSSGAATIDFGPSSAPLSTLFGLPTVSKKFTAMAPSSVTECRTQNNAGLLLGNAFANVMVSASLTAVVALKEPIVIAPGRGLLVQNEMNGMTLSATFEYFEESVV